MNKNKGKLITLEGIDDVGKTTHRKLLCRWLEEQGYDVVETWEPWDNWIRDFLNAEKYVLLPQHKVCEQARLFFFLADRVEHVRRIINPALESGKIVICDRYHYSTIAYQGYGEGLIDMIKVPGWNYYNFPRPDLTLWLNNGIPEDEFLSKVWDGYHKEWKYYGLGKEEIIVQDKIEDTQELIRNAVIKIMKEDKR